MFWLKACKRCGGDLHEEPDITGLFVVCLQCGHELNAEEEAEVRHESATANVGGEESRQAKAA